MNEQQQTPAPILNNTNKATLVGVGAGAGGSTVIAWLAVEAERRYGVPFAVGTVILGSAFGFVARWAAKLMPS